MNISSTSVQKNVHDSLLELRKYFIIGACASPIFAVSILGAAVLIGSTSAIGNAIVVSALCLVILSDCVHAAINTHIVIKNLLNNPNADFRFSEISRGTLLIKYFLAL